MGELRKDLYSNQFVLIEESRARRPTDQQGDHPLLPWEGECPFCEGREHLTPPEVVAVRKFGGKPDEKGWTIRVVPNKYPAVMPSGKPEWQFEAAYQWMMSVGRHEVIIETAHHDARLTDLSLEDMTSVIRMYRDRCRILAEDPRWQAIVLFRNSGSRAGASLVHPHAQVVALPSIPRRLLDMTTYAVDQWTSRKACAFCDLVIRERASGARVVYENEHFLVFQPFAPRVPFETLIFPRSHQSRFMVLTDEEAPFFANALQECLGRFDRLLNKPPYNLVIHSAPLKARIDAAMHWHSELMPRLGELGGFEWGSDCYMHPVFPEQAAQLLRNA